MSAAGPPPSPYCQHCGKPVHEANPRPVPDPDGVLHLMPRLVHSATVREYCADGRHRAERR